MIIKASSRATAHGWSQQQRSCVKIVQLGNAGTLFDNILPRHRDEKEWVELTLQTVSETRVEGNEATRRVVTSSRFSVEPGLFRVSADMEGRPCWYRVHGGDGEPGWMLEGGGRNIGEKARTNDSWGVSCNT